MYGYHKQSPGWSDSAITSCSTASAAPTSAALATPGEGSSAAPTAQGFKHNLHWHLLHRQLRVSHFNAMINGVAAIATRGSSRCTAANAREGAGALRGH